MSTYEWLKCKGERAGRAGEDEALTHLLTLLALVEADKEHEEVVRDSWGHRGTNPKIQEAVTKRRAALARVMED